MRSQNSENQVRRNLRILWAITRNDLVEALKNKNIVINIVFALAVAVFYRYLPEIGALTEGETQILLVYAQGESGLAPLLEGDEQIRAYIYDSEEEMRGHLSNSDQPELGLVIPAGFDQAPDAGTPVQLEGYVMNWLRPDRALEQKRLAEEEIYRLSGHAVEINIEGNLVYPDPESHGLSVTASFGLVYILLMTALPTIPYLFMEEKKSRTLDALMVSPASAWQIVGGKALTGMIYTLLGTFIGLFVFNNAFVHWWLVFPVILLGSLLTVSLGLLMGIRIENREQLMLGMWILIIPLVVPVFLSIMEPLIPHSLTQVFRFIPTTTLFNLLRFTMAGQIPWVSLLLWSGWLAAWVIGLLVLVIRQVKRLDRGDEPSKARLADLQTKPGKPLSTQEGQHGAAAGLLGSMSNAALIRVETAGSPGTALRTTPSGWKIILAIAVKDMREALKSKVFVSILLGVSIMAGFNTLLPLLVRGSAKPTYMVVDPGQSEAVPALMEREDLRLIIVESEAEMEAGVVDSLGAALGLVIPADFDRRLQAGEEVVIAEYRDHVASRKRMVQWEALFAEAVLQGAGLNPDDGTVRFEENVLYPQADGFGQYSMVGIVLAVVVFTIGAALVPLLFLEEKESHTLDALLVSPARPGQVVVGKALTGGVYCLLAGGILMLLNMRTFVHLETAVLALLLTTLFAVAVGLLLGVSTKNPTNAGVLGSLLLLVLIALTVLGLLSPAWMPQLLRTVLSWLPGATVMALFRVSVAGEIPAGMLLANAGALLAASLLLYGLILWMVRREGVG